MGLFSFFDKKPSKYDVVEYSVGNNQTDNQISLQAGWHSKEKKPYGGLYITVDQTVTLKFNSTTNPSITVTASQSPFTVDYLVVSDIFISTGASGCNFKVLAVHV